MISFALLGLGLGAVYAISSTGLILIYRGAGIINFAQGAFAAVGAYTYFEVTVRNDLPVGVGLVVGMLVSAILGGLVYLLAMRPLRHLTPLARVIATLGVMTLIQQVLLIRYGGAIRSVPSLLPADRVEVLPDATVGVDRLILLAIGAVVSCVLWAYYRFTLFGQVTTAVAENELTAQLSGHSPDRIALINWVAGATLGGVAGVFIAPIAGLNPEVLVLLIVPALAAGLVGGFTSFPAALVASLVMGVSQSLMTRYISIPGWSDAVPFLVVILILVVRGQSLPLRSHILERLPSIGSGRINPKAAAAAIALGGFLLLISSARWADALATSFIIGTVAMSLVVLTGYAGQLSLAQVALAGLAGFASTRLNDTVGVPFELGFLVGVVVAVLAGLLVGIPALRTRGINLAIVTFGLAFAVQSIIFQNHTYTGGTSGTVIDPPDVFGWSLDSIQYPKRYALAGLVILVLSGFVAANVRRGRTGRRLVAVRSNERAAAALGISVYGAKFYAFAVSAGLAGMAGVLLASRYPFVQFNQFDVFQSIEAVLLIVITGIGYVAGAVMAALGFRGGAWNEFVSNRVESGNVYQYVTAILSVGLIVGLARFPNGMAGEILERRREKRQAKADKRAARRPAEGQRERETAPTTTMTNGGRPDLAVVGVVRRIEIPPRTLTVDSISVQFGLVKAVDDVSLSVGPGQVLGVMGPNGAGKTTLIDAVTGFVAHQTGSVAVDGQPIDGVSPSRRSRLGVVRSFQSLELFEEITVYDNLLTASDEWQRSAYLKDLVKPGRSKLGDAALAAVDVLQLADTLHRLPTELPFGQRRLVAIARAMASSPSIVLLDEPAAGLDERESTELGRLIRLLADEWGFAILLVDHNVPMLMSTCDRIVAMDFGRLIGEGTPEELRNNPAVVASYLGVEEPEAAPRDRLDPSTADVQGA